MKQKKLLLLGGLRYLLPVIETAHKEGYYVITCDYLPDNIAHKYSDEYHNVSIIDKDAVLKLAQELKIDGIMSFAVDPGVVTAAYVAQKMNLPFQCSYETACILQDKARFRKFLKDNRFNCPKAKGYSNIEEALNDKERFDYPVIVKPVDSAGSKGVTKVERKEDLLDALRIAMSESHTDNIIIEDFLEKVGCSSDTDSFSIDGKMQFVSFSAQRFDENAANAYAPAAFSWPSTFGEAHEYGLRNELQRLADLLQLRTGIYNIESRVCTDGKEYIMEFSPRAGGNRLAEVLRYATKQDLIKASVRSAVGDDIENLSMPVYNGAWAEIILHGDKKGKFKELQVSPNVEKYVVERDLWVKEGDVIDSFNGANNAIGTLILKFDNQEQLDFYLSSQKDWLKIITE